MRPIRLAVPLLAAFLGAGCARAPKVEVPATPVVAPITTTRALVERMRERWNARYFRTLVFRQKNTLYRQDGTEELSEWLEWQSVPRRLRVEFLPADGKNGLLYRDNVLHNFQNGKLVNQRPSIHPLLLLSADVYALPVDTTMRELASLRIDTTVLRPHAWEGRQVLVVGAEPSDSTASQFWIDADRMVLLRIVQRNTNAQGRVSISDTRFTEYQEVDGVPVPKVIVFRRDGRPYWREEYVEPRLNVPIDDAMFDPAQWAARFGTGVGN